MNQLEVLEIYKADAMEQLADNERVTAAQKERIATLEYHLGRCRDSAYQMCYATVGVLPIDYVPDAKAEKKKVKK